MKNIEYFKFKETSEFFAFLYNRGRKLEDVKGFKFAGQKQCHGNILKTYNVCFNDGKCECFKVIIFDDFNEYRQTLLGRGCNKLSKWFGDSQLREIKENL